MTKVYYTHIHKHRIFRFADSSVVQKKVNTFVDFHLFLKKIPFHVRRQY